MLKSIEKGNDINSISSGSELKGSLNTTGDVRIDGLLVGTVKTQGRLVLGEAGSVEGEVYCNTGIISGEINAKITSKELLTLRSTAKVTGEIVTNQLAIEPGAIFTGQCSMGPVVKKINKKIEETDGDTKQERSA